MCAECRNLLSAGLDICVRARNMESIDRRATALSASKDPEAWQADGTFDRYVERYNIDCPDRPIHTRSATLSLRYIDQYETDLAEWERKSRHHLMQGCAAGRDGE